MCVAVQAHHFTLSAKENPYSVIFRHACYVLARLYQTLPLKSQAFWSELEGVKPYVWEFVKKNGERVTYNIECNFFVYR